MEACRTDWRQMWGHVNYVKLIFFTKSCFSELILAQIEFPELDSDRFLGLGTKNLAILGILNGKWEMCDFWLRKGFVELKNVERGACEKVFFYRRTCL